MSLRGSPTFYDFTSFKFAEFVFIAQIMADRNDFMCIIKCYVHSSVVGWNIPYMSIKPILPVVLFRFAVSLQNSNGLTQILSSKQLL